MSASLPSFLAVVFYLANKSASVAWALAELLDFDRRETFPAIRASERKDNSKNRTHIGPSLLREYHRHSGSYPLLGLVLSIDCSFAAVIILK